MNCKPGDLAYIVKSDEGNNRRFVTVKFDSGRRDSRDHWWVCESASDIRSFRNGIIRAGDLFVAADSNLRPIRGGETDEQSLEAMRDLMQTKKEKVTT